VAPRDDQQPALGAAVKHYRERAGLTQEELGHAANVHATWVSRLESGKLNPAWGSIVRVAAALGVEVSTLARWAERQPRS
jgi:transcriptional regulator with XRE-family HTH domain